MLQPAPCGQCPGVLSRRASGPGRPLTPDARSLTPGEHGLQPGRAFWLPHRRGLVREHTRRPLARAPVVCTAFRHPAQAGRYAPWLPGPSALCRLAAPADVQPRQLPRMQARGLARRRQLWRKSSALAFVPCADLACGWESAGERSRAKAAWEPARGRQARWPAAGGRALPGSLSARRRSPSGSQWRSCRSRRVHAARCGDRLAGCFLLAVFLRACTGGTRSVARLPTPAVLRFKKDSSRFKKIQPCGQACQVAVAAEASDSHPGARRRGGGSQRARLPGV